MMIIDPPSLFAPKDEWRAHLKELRAAAIVHPDDRDLADAIREAEAVLFADRAATAAL